MRMSDTTAQRMQIELSLTSWTSVSRAGWSAA
jgi:hypothetical protein